MRWDPMPLVSYSCSVDFIQGWHTIGKRFGLLFLNIILTRAKGGAGEPTMKAGMAIHGYSANASMKDKCFYNSDGDLLIGR